MSPTHLCKHLRTKSMYIPALSRENRAGAPLEPSGCPAHYWCNCTSTETGPDDKQVGPGACDNSRSCFEE